MIYAMPIGGRGSFPICVLALKFNMLMKDSVLQHERVYPIVTGIYKAA
jgi:hypothetical protein